MFVAVAVVLVVAVAVLLVEPLRLAAGLVVEPAPVVAAGPVDVALLASDRHAICTQENKNVRGGEVRDARKHTYMHGNVVRIWSK